MSSKDKKKGSATKAADKPKDAGKKDKGKKRSHAETESAAEPDVPVATTVSDPAPASKRRNRKGGKSGDGDAAQSSSSGANGASDQAGGAKAGQLELEAKRVVQQLAPATSASPKKGAATASNGAAATAADGKTADGKKKNPLMYLSSLATSERKKISSDSPNSPSAQQGNEGPAAPAASSVDTAPTLILPSSVVVDVDMVPVHSSAPGSSGANGASSSAAAKESHPPRPRRPHEQPIPCRAAACLSRDIRVLPTLYHLSRHIRKHHVVGRATHMYECLGLPRGSKRSLANQAVKDRHQKKFAGTNHVCQIVQIYDPTVDDPVHVHPLICQLFDIPDTLRDCAKARFRRKFVNQAPATATATATSASS